MTPQEIADRFCERAYDAGQCVRLIRELIARERAEAVEGEREATLNDRERHWVAEIDRLRTILAWCRPRLMHDYYRGALDRYIADPNLATNADHSKLVQSAAIRTRPAEQENTDAT